MPKPILTPKTLSALSQGNFYKIITTEEYSTWKAGLRDAVALRAIRGTEVILLLLGGNKRTQQADIAKAQSMADMDIEEEQ